MDGREKVWMDGWKEGWIEEIEGWVGYGRWIKKEGRWRSGGPIKRKQQEIEVFLILTANQTKQVSVSPRSFISSVSTLVMSRCKLSWCNGVV